MPVAGLRGTLLESCLLSRGPPPCPACTPPWRAGRERPGGGGPGLTRPDTGQVLFKENERHDQCD
ncbi:hypothetical protein GCM10017782_25510 [Deinococcus ficus]|nr:hypothetical protein GCM10017782_25510 [Deinococcus ficus]